MKVFVNVYFSFFYFVRDSLLSFAMSSYSMKLIQFKLIRTTDHMISDCSNRLDLKPKFLGQQTESSAIGAVVTSSEIVTFCKVFAHDSSQLHLSNPQCVQLFGHLHLRPDYYFFWYEWMFWFWCAEKYLVLKLRGYVRMFWFCTLSYICCCLDFYPWSIPFLVYNS